MWNLHKKRKSPCKMLRQITFFRVLRFPKRCSAIFNVSNAWTNMWNKTMEDRQWPEVYDSCHTFCTLRESENTRTCEKLKRGDQEAESQLKIQKEWECLHCGESFRGFGFYRPSVIKLAGPTWKTQARRSSDSSESEKKKSLTRRWGSLV